LTYDTITSQLIDIANLCPDYGGPAVYWARALLRNAFPTITWNDADLCTGLDSLMDTVPSQEFRKSALGESVIELKISPIPSTGRLNISITKNVSGILIVYNNIGQKVKEYINPSSIDMIDLSGMSGIFYLKLVDDSENVLLTKKCIIIN